METKQEKTIRPVTNSPAKVKKKSELRRIGESFISEEARNIPRFLAQDVFIPTTKNLIYDFVMGGLGMLLFGKFGARQSRTGSGSRVDRVSWVDNSSRIDYSGASKKTNYDEPRDRPRFDYGMITFETRGEAEACLDQMCEVISTYGFVTVADMYDMVQLTQPYTSANYGWDNLSQAIVERVRDGYIIKLPKAKPIRR